MLGAATLTTKTSKRPMNAATRITGSAFQRRGSTSVTCSWAPTPGTLLTPRRVRVGEERRRCRPTCAGRHRGSRVLRDHRDVLGLWALVTFAGLELDLRTFGKRLEAATRDARVVDEKVLAALIGRDEAI